MEHLLAELIETAAAAVTLYAAHAMEHPSAELIGIAAAAASLYAAHARTIIPLRVAAIVANALAMTYSFLHGTYPTLALNAILLPLNAWRLRAMLHLIRDIDIATKSDMNVDWLLPYTRPAHFKAGEIMMQRGDYATAAFYVMSGEIEMVEIDRAFGRGTLVGEIGLFAPDGRRNMTVRCKTDVDAAQIDYDRFKELYFQNPQFGFRLLHLIVARMQGNLELSQSSPVT
jgi:CRP/FNR family transcriptional regulator, cyclic AMP receptor protein